MHTNILLSFVCGQRTGAVQLGARRTSQLSEADRLCRSATFSRRVSAADDIPGAPVGRDRPPVRPVVSVKSYKGSVTGSATARLIGFV